MRKVMIFVVRIVFFSSGVFMGASFFAMDSGTRLLLDRLPKISSFKLEEDRLRDSLLRSAGVGVDEWNYEIEAAFEKRESVLEQDIVDSCASSEPVKQEHRDFIEPLLHHYGLQARGVGLVSLKRRADCLQICSASARCILIDNEDFSHIPVEIRGGIIRHEISHVCHRDVLTSHCMDALLARKGKEKTPVYYAWLRAREKRADLEFIDDLSPIELFSYAGYWYARSLCIQLLGKECYLVHPDDYNRYQYVLDAYVRRRGAIEKKC